MFKLNGKLRVGLRTIKNKILNLEFKFLKTPIKNIRKEIVKYPDYRFGANCFSNNKVRRGFNLKVKPTFGNLIRSYSSLRKLKKGGKVVCVAFI
jgi:hypothetical protein